MSIIKMEDQYQIKEYMNILYMIKIFININEQDQYGNTLLLNIARYNYRRNKIKKKKINKILKLLINYVDNHNIVLEINRN